MIRISTKCFLFLKTQKSLKTKMINRIRKLRPKPKPPTRNFTKALLLVVGWFVGWFVGCVLDVLFDGLLVGVGWFVGWFVGWCWLVCWLVGLLVVAGKFHVFHQVLGGQVTCALQLTGMRQHALAESSHRTYCWHSLVSGVLLHCVEYSYQCTLRLWYLETSMTSVQLTGATPLMNVSASSSTSA